MERHSSQKRLYSRKPRSVALPDLLWPTSNHKIASAFAQLHKRKQRESFHTRQPFLSYKLETNNCAHSCQCVQDLKSKWLLQLYLLETYREGKSIKLDPIWRPEVQKTHKALKFKSVDPLHLHKQAQTQTVYKRKRISSNFERTAVSIHRQPWQRVLEQADDEFENFKPNHQ